MPGLLSGWQAGQEAGRVKAGQAQALEEQRQQTEELKAKNLWDKEYQMFKSATDWANKLPVGRRGQYLNNYLTKQTGGSPEFKSIVDAMSSDDEETRKQMQSITKEINDAMQKGTDPELPISKLESIVGADDPSVKFFKSKFTKYKEELFNEDVSAVADMMESDGKVDDEEAIKFAMYQKKDPKIIIEASKILKAKKEAMGGATEKTYAPKLTAWSKDGNVIYVDMNKPEDVTQAQAQGYTEQPKGVNQLTEEDIGLLAEGIQKGQIRPESMPSRRSERTKIYTRVMKDNPNFNFSDAEANYKFRTNTSNLRALGLTTAVKPRISDLILKVQRLKNVVPTELNKPMNALKKQLGDTNIVDYESLRNAVIQEVNTALAGTSVQSDYRIKLELENLGSDRTIPQLETALTNLMRALDARQDASYAVPFPWEVVRGEMTLDEYRKNLEKESKESQQSAKSGKPPLVIR